jgi:hypothetical protein
MKTRESLLLAAMAAAVLCCGVLFRAWKFERDWNERLRADLVRCADRACWPPPTISVLAPASGGLDPIRIRDEAQ